MKQKPMKKITYWLSIVVIGIALGFAIQFVRAWTEPTDAPPNGNVGAPINTSANWQQKIGALVLGNPSGGQKGAGSINAEKVCINGVCQTSWPSGGSSSESCGCTMRELSTYGSCYGGIGGDSCYATWTCQLYTDGPSRTVTCYPPGIWTPN